MDKCKKEGGEEKDLKASFRNLINRIKKTGKGQPAEKLSEPQPEFIPDPDAIKFSGFPDTFSVADFMSWLDEQGVSVMEPMCFKEGKPGSFSISTVEDDNGEVLALDTEDAQEMVTKLNGVEHSGRRIMVTMVAMMTPEKKKRVVTLNDTPEGDQLALEGPTGEEGAEQIDLDVSSDDGDLNDDDGGEVIMKTPENKEPKKQAPIKLNITITQGGTKQVRVPGEKIKRADLSDTSLEASPQLDKKNVKVTETAKAKEAKEVQSDLKPSSKRTTKKAKK